MATIVIVTRKTRKGHRYQVRYRLGGRAYPLLHAGVFETQKEAKQRRDLVAGEIAHGRNPQLVLDQLQTPAPARRTFATVAADYQASRIDITDGSRLAIETHVKALLPAFGMMAPEAITPADVQAWITQSTLKPRTRRQYVGTLRLVLDHARVDPNPARDRSIRFPRVEREVVQPPSSREVRAILEHVPERWRLPIRILCATGLRVSELAHVTWGDVDVAESQFRIAKGKTLTARRWAPVRADLMAELLGLVPPDDRTPTSRVFS